MATALRRLFSCQPTLVQTTRYLVHQRHTARLTFIRHGHAGVIEPHRLKPQKQRVPCKKLLQAIRKGDQQAVWIQYAAMLESKQVGRLSAEYHSMVLRAFGLQNVITYGPEEITAVKERLLMIWANMKQHGHIPDIRDYQHMLGFAGRASDWALCETVWTELMEQSKHRSNSLWGLTPNVYSYNAYMLAAIQCNRPEKVASIFNTMQQQAKIQPNKFSYNTLMDAYGHLGDVAEVDRIFDRVFVRQKQQQYQLKTLSSLLHPEREASTPLGRKVATLTRHAPALTTSATATTNASNKMTPTVDTFLSLIDAHGRHGNTMGLEMIYNKMMPEFNIEPTLAIYNGLIRWYCQKSDIETAKRLLVDMEKRGIQPNVVTFNYVFRHEALKRNRPGVAEKLLDIMHQMYQLQPLQSMYRHLIRIHNRHNRDQEVERLLRSYELSMGKSSDITK